MDLLKKFWPLGFKAKKGDVVSLIVWLVIGIIFCAVVGWVIGLVASLPIINIFGGITRCDEVAGGVKLAMERGSLEGKITVVRMEGTNKDKAIEILDGLHSDIIRVEGLRESIAALLERRDRL